MRTYIDQSRISRNSDRRLHAADLEMSGRFVQLVPAIAHKLASRAVTSDWSLEVERLKKIEEDFGSLKETHEQHRCQRERWWCELWAQPQGLYRVKAMTREERGEARRLLNDSMHGLPSECFPDARGPLDEHNDALIVAQVIVMGGHLIVTSNMTFVETEPLEDWRRKHGNQYGTPPEVPLVQQADAMYSRWLTHPIGREVLEAQHAWRILARKRHGKRKRSGARSHPGHRSARARRPHHGLRRAHAQSADSRARKDERGGAPHAREPAGSHARGRTPLDRNVRRQKRAAQSNHITDARHTLVKGTLALTAVRHTPCPQTHLAEVYPRARG